MRTPAVPFRRPIPIARSILWTPVGVAGGARAVEGEGEVAVFIAQGALREMMRHLRSDPEQELLGFLAGELFESPATGARYVVATSAIRTGYAIPEVEPVQIPDQEWQNAQLEVRRRRTLLVGWYHSAPFVGHQPARLDLETHRARFAEPWAFGVVIATSGDAPAGGVFRPLPGDAESGGGGTLLPFFEMLDAPATTEQPGAAAAPGGAEGEGAGAGAGAGEPKRTLIDWVNYRTDAPVEPDVAERRPHVPPPRPSARAAGAAGAGGAANGRGENGDGTPWDVDALFAGSPAPSLPVMIPEPAAPDDTLPLPQPRLERRIRFGGAMIAILLGGLAAAAGVFWWNQRGVPEPPGGLGGSPSGRSAAAGRTAASPARQGNDAPLTAAPGTTAVADTFARGAAPGTTRRGAPARGTVPNVGTGAVSTPNESAGGVPAGTGATIAPGAGGSGTASAAGAAAPAPTSDPAVMRFDALADSLDQAIRNFGDRASDFALQRLTCDGLATGYRSVDDAFIALAATYKSAHASLDDSRIARYRDLVGQMEGVNEKFDASKCPRP